MTATTLLTTAEAAARLDLTDRRVRQLIDAGKLAAQLKGRIYLIELKNVVALAKQRAK